MFPKEQSIAKSYDVLLMHYIISENLFCKNGNENTDAKLK